MHSLQTIARLNDRAVEKELDDREDDLKLDVYNVPRPSHSWWAKHPRIDRVDLSFWGTCRELADHHAARLEVARLRILKTLRRRQAWNLREALFGGRELT